MDYLKSPFNGEQKCKDAPSDIFFPDIYEDTYAERLAKTKAAKKVCSLCPIRVECLKYALAHTSLKGIWGKTTTTERDMMRARNGRILEHGGAEAYRRA